MKRFIMFSLAFLSLLIVLSGCKSSYIWFEVSKSFNTNESPWFKIYCGEKPKNIEIKLYRVPTDDFSDFLKIYYGNLAIEDMNLSALKEVSGVEYKYDIQKGEWYYGNYVTVTLNPQKAGLYIVRADLSDKVGFCIMEVTDAKLLVSWMGSDLIITASDAIKGTALSGIDIYGFNPYKKEEPKLIGKTDDLGLLRIEYDWKTTEQEYYHYLLLYTVADEGPSFCTPYQSYYVEGTNEYIVGHIFTDRPIYRPNQDVNFKLFARNMVDQKPQNIPGKTASVVVKSPDGEEIYKTNLTLSDYGTAFSNFHLDDDAALGYYYIDATIDNNYIESYFEVQEYRKPEFIVEATPDRPYYLTGDTVKINVDTNYYFGGAVKGAEVKWSAANNYNGIVLGEGSGVTSADGSYEITFKAPEYENYNYYVYLNIDVTDQSRRQVSTTLYPYIYYYDISLYAYADRYLVKVGDKVGIQVSVSDILGNPISKDVVLKIEQEYYNESKKEWDYKTFLEDEISIGNAGMVVYDYEPKEAGYYRVTCDAVDSRGHKLTTYGYFWATGGEYAYYWWWDISGGKGIITDKTEYTIGEKALVQLNVEPEFAVVDLIITGGKIYDVYHIPVENHTASLEVPIKPAYYPNIMLSLIYSKESGYYYDTASLNIKDPSKSLDVSLKMDKKEYRPGDEAKWKVTVLDNSGKPKIADVSVAMVDEALYAIREEDKTKLESVFYPYTYGYPSVVSSDEFYYGSYGVEKEEAATLEKSMEGAGGGPGAGGMDKTAEIKAAPEMTKDKFTEARVRKEFKDTGFWLPSIITGADGIANISFKMPDNLTTWRTTIHSITKDTLTGEIREKTLTTKKLIVRLITPRTFTQKDRVTISAVVTNYLPEPKKVKAYIEGDRVDLISDKTQYITVGAGDTARVDWKIDVIGTGESTLTAYALTDIESDAMEVKVPIVPHGLKTVVYDSTVAVDGKTQIVFNIPTDVRLDSASIRLDFSPSIASTAFNSLEYLAGYPYGCVEQTMSRFLPDVYLVNILQKTGLTIESKLMDELPKMIDDGLTRLYDFQHDDGGWGWWKDDQTNPYMTAYVIYGLSLARDADVMVKDDVLLRGAEALKTMIPKEKDTNTLCYMLYALSYAPNINTAFIYEIVSDKGLMKKLDDLNPYAISVLGVALSRSKLTNDALLISEELKRRAIDSGGIVHWESSSIRGGWYDSSTEATSYCLRFLIEQGEEDDYLQKVVMWLVKNRRGYYWYSTKDTAACIMALADYVEYTGEFAPNYTATISVNGNQKDSFAITKADILSGHRVIKLKGDELKKGDNIVEVLLKGEGRLYSSYELTYYTPGEGIKSIDKGITISRSFEEKRATGARYDISEGDKVNVYLTMKVNEPVDYLILEDYKPAGCEFEEDYEFQKNYIYGWDWYYYWYLPYTIEVRDEKICFFFDHLEPGEYSFAYRLRGETPGEFHTMPAVAYAMYSPDFGGSSDEVVLTIKAKRAD